ncbi:lysophospholipid acyltransferase family protein [Aeromicrobium sp.]|uniref:lysophospholipid acyltransferase family protein n=1 Tax=Aeromicrobium sp. TaxID=1871063 RepID=UPI003D6A52C0
MTFWLVVAVVRLFNLVTGHRVVRHGVGRLPADGAAVLAINHTAYVDFIYVGLEAYRHERRQVRFMGKVELSGNPILRWAMRGCGVIPVDRSAGRGSFVAAVEELRRGEVVGIYPEATISRSFELKAFKSGAARMALEADVPIIPAIVWGAQRIATKGRPKHLGRTKTPVTVDIGEPIAATGTPEDLTARLRDAMQAMLLGVQDSYGPHPAGEDWVPARLDGSAPTLAEADEIDRQAKKT